MLFSSVYVKHCFFLQKELFPTNLINFSVNSKLIIVNIISPISGCNIGSNDFSKSGGNIYQNLATYLNLQIQVPGSVSERITVLTVTLVWQILILPRIFQVLWFCYKSYLVEHLLVTASKLNILISWWSSIKYYFNRFTKKADA